MGKRKRAWQDVEYVLRYFGETIGEARRAYVSYVKAGVDQGRREDLTGGGLIRSLGGWAEAKRQRLRGQARIKGDERILGDSDFVREILEEADEKLTRECELRMQGYDMAKVVEKVAKIYGMDVRDIVSKGRQRERVAARSLVCYWAVRELRMSLTDVGRGLGMSPPGVGAAVQRGEAIARENNFELLD